MRAVLTRCVSPSAYLEVPERPFAAFLLSLTPGYPAAIVGVVTDVYDSVSGKYDTNIKMRPEQSLRRGCAASSA